MSEGTSTSWAARERPGCVTVYAILTMISGGLIVIVSLIAALGAGDLGGGALCLGGFTLLFAAIPIATGIGLWQMRKWGWALVVVVQGLGIIGGLLQLALLLGLGGDYIAGDPAFLCSSLVSLGVSGYIVYWFVTNRELFNGGTAYKEVVGPDGETIMEPVEKKGNDTMTILAIVGGIAAVFVLVCIVVIAMLAILGPQIGNVFSQITFTLENPAPGVILLAVVRA